MHKNWRNVIRELEKLGWYIARNNRHVIMKHPNRPNEIMTLPANEGRDITPGLKNHLKKVGVII